MKNILLITTIYPLPIKDNKGTPVCHYFAIEWLKMGYNVRVVHFQAVYPKPFYWVARLARKKIIAKTSAVVYTERDKGGRYEMDGVRVFRIPLYKPIPHGKFSQKAVNDSILAIVNWLKEDDFCPDVITGHFPNPQIEVVSRLKDIWPQAKSAIVMHIESDNESIRKVYGNRFEKFREKIDIWGFRNEPLRKMFEKQVMTLNQSFICYSGIPEDYITKDNVHDFKKPLRSFVYVGAMIERKYPLQVLDALLSVYPEKDFTLSYVGNGGLLNEIKKRIQRENLSKCVNILGNIPRDKIKKQYDNSDCMIMISSGEAYGLVYLEAMARGCITIASRNEGFDGVIIDGVNGFLCKAGDATELAGILSRINQMTAEERQKISDNAIKTAQSLTDFKAAKRYIEDLRK